LSSDTAVPLSADGRESRYQADEEELSVERWGDFAAAIVNWAKSRRGTTMAEAVDRLGKAF